MQLKSGHEFLISQDLRKEIESYPSRICTPQEIKVKYANKKVISVGDVTTKVLHENQIIPFIEIVDLRTKRNMPGEFRSIPGSLRVRNPPATITHDLFLAVARLINVGGGRIEIDGEEDLAVIPIIFYSDINTVVTYGVPDVGMACIEVNDTVKGQVKSLIERMEVKCQN